jgi:TPP-dependent pyruvate/acetoin dehydrogenase alpha subunit
VQRVPAVFIVQNNQVALGTSLEKHHLPGGFDELPEAYGMWGAVFDGNNVLDAWAAATLAVDRCRAGDGPAMLVANTFRMGGHATHDEREARATFSADLFASWGKRDPIGLFEAWGVGRGMWDVGRLSGIEAGCRQRAVVRRAARRDLRAARSQWRGQDHHGAHGARHHPARRGDDPDAAAR